ncbi:MAG TPA: hypothetical protein VF990_00915 [Candidatus Dormibacteraeota bacterium]
MAAIRAPINLRIKVGLVLTGVSLLLLIFPGYMALPLTALTPLIPHMSGCANFGIGLVAIAFFGLAFLISAAIIVVGVLAVIGTALRSRIGLVGACLINALVVSLLLMTPLDFSANQDPGAIGLDILLDICALIPAAALALLLSPAVFGSWWHASRPFVVMAVAVGTLLLPGAAGTISLGQQVAGMPYSQAAQSPTGTRGC